MGLTYNKETITKDRRVVTSGPRDRQIKQQQQATASNDASDIEELKAQVNALKEASGSQVTNMTSDQINSEIALAIQEETDKLRKSMAQLMTDKVNLEIKIKTYVGREQDYSDAIQSYQRTISEKDAIISQKDVTISELNRRVTSDDNKLTALLTEATKKIEDAATNISQGQFINNEITNDMSDRPKMETIYVDPTDKESNVETHITIEDVSITEKEKMSDSVNKLKGLLGKLPNKGMR